MAESKSKLAQVQLGDLPAGTAKIWDDLSTFTTVAKFGSFVKAEAYLGVNHTTLSRRISHLEDVLGVELFRRSSTGLVVTEIGASILAQAEQMELSVRAIERIARGDAPAHRQAVTLAVSDGLATYKLAPALPSLKESHPDVLLTFLCSHSPVNLANNQADIVIGFTPYDSFDILNSVLGTITMCPFASRDYLTRFGRPESLKDLASHSLIDHAAYGIDEADWSLWSSQVGQRPGFRTNLSSVHYEMVRSGVGIGMLPNYAELDDTLVKLDLDYELSMKMYLSYPRALRMQPATRAVIEWLRWVFREQHANWFQHNC